MISNELRTGFNLWGANLVVIAILITALFMTTRFSFSGAHAWASKGPIGAVEKLGILQKVQARWHAWRDSREDERMRRRLQETRTSGRKPVNQATGKSVAEPTEEAEQERTIHLPDETDIFGRARDYKELDKREKEKEEARERETSKAPIFVMNSEKAEKPVKKASEAKIAKGTHQLQAALHLPDARRRTQPKDR